VAIKNMKNTTKNTLMGHYNRRLKLLMKTHVKRTAIRILNSQIKRGFLDNAYLPIMEEKKNTPEQARNKFKNNKEIKYKVRERFNNTCACGERNKLKIRHIESIEKRPDLATNIDNLYLVCNKCYHSSKQVVPTSPVVQTKTKEA
jgi:uncharacterized protein YdaT